MQPLLSLISLMIVTIVLGKGNWSSKSVKYAIVVVVAMLQTILVLIGMFTMKAPTARLPY